MNSILKRNSSIMNEREENCSEEEYPQQNGSDAKRMKCEPNLLKEIWDCPNGEEREGEREEIEEDENEETEESDMLKCESHRSIFYKLEFCSYALSLQLAKKKMPYSDAEDFLLPSVLVIVENMLGPDESSVFKQLSLSKEKFRHQIGEMASDVREQVVASVKASDCFSLLLDECTDTANEAYLLVFARYVGPQRIEEELLMCEAVNKDCHAEGVYGTISKFFAFHGIDWAGCVSISCDATATLTGKDLVSVFRIRQAHISWHQCLIHRQVMASKDVLSLLSTALTVAVRIVNLIKNRPLQSSFSQDLRTDFHGDYKFLLEGSDTRWLSKGNVLQHVFEHREEVLRVLNDLKNTNLASYVQDGVWLLSIAYLADFFDKINAIVPSDTLTAFTEIDALKRKLSVWERRLQSGVTEMFPLLTKCIARYPKEWNNVVKKVVCVHLPQVLSFFEGHYPPEAGLDWVRNPFLADSEDQVSLSIPEKDRFLDLSCDRRLKLEFKHQTLEQFWLSVQDSYPLLAKKALLALMPFSSPSLSQLAVSGVLQLMNAERESLDVESYLILWLSKINPNIRKLCSSLEEPEEH